MIRKEACCGSVGDVIIAEKLGFDQIELNSSLENGGMTPSVGTLVMAKKVTNIPIYPMVRARPQGFNYIEEEYQAMLIDARILIENGANGIVFGFLNEDATINLERTKEMVRVIKSYDKEAIFHKAFDSTVDLEVSIQQLIDLGVDRILTGAGVGNIMDNLDVMKHLQSTYGDQIDILVGGGVRDHNVQEIIERTGVDKIHFSGSTKIFDASTHVTSHNRDKKDHSYIGVSEENMRGIIEAINKVGE